MNTKDLIAKALAPAALKTADSSREKICTFVFNQPEMPEELNDTVA